MCCWHRHVDICDRERPGLCTVVGGIPSRDPLFEDERVDYDVDTDEEWFENEGGDTCSEGERSVDSDSCSDDSGVVSDGHLSADEARRSSDCMFPSHVGWTRERDSNRERE